VVAVPLLAHWLRRNLDPAPVEGEQTRHRRLSLLAFGASLTALLLGITWTWLSTERALTRSSGLACQISVDHPRRAAAGETVRVHVLHDCPTPATAPPAPPVPNVHLRARMAAAAFPVGARACPAAHSCPFEIVLEEQALPSYQLGVEVDHQRLDFAIARDSLGEARRVLASGVRIASLLPMLIAGFLAYQRELRSVLRRLLRLGRGEEDGSSPSSPGAGGASTT
jgi:hypothetical protein